MTTEWNNCPTIEDVVEAKKRGDDIEVYGMSRWASWTGGSWSEAWKFRCRPAQPQTKTITLRKAMLREDRGCYPLEHEADMSKWDCFICWLGEPYTV